MRTDSTWNLDSARQLYRIRNWGNGYFDINDQGHVAMCLPHSQQQVDLYAFAQRVHQENGMRFPLLVRFVNVLHDRVQRLPIAFNKAIAESGRSSRYTAIYPINVNQQRSVVQQILAGGKQQVGLEAGSKPELMAVLGSAPEGCTIVCYGF